MKQKKRIQKTFRSLYPFLMMQSASYGFLLICTYLHQALLALAEFTALFQNFRVFIPVIRELFLSNASSDAGRHPRFPGYPLAFLPSCQSVHSLGRNCRSRATILFFMIFYQKLYHIFTNCVNHPKQNSSHFFHIQRNRLAFIFIILNFFHFHDMKLPYLPDIGGWTDATGEEGFLPVFRTPEHFPAP